MVRLSSCISDELMKELKEISSKEKRSVSQIVEILLNRAIKTRKASVAKK